MSGLTQPLDCGKEQEELPISREEAFPGVRRVVQIRLVLLYFT